MVDESSQLNEKVCGWDGMQWLCCPVATAQTLAPNDVNCARWLLPSSSSQVYTVSDGV